MCLQVEDNGDVLEELDADAVADPLPNKPAPHKKTRAERNKVKRLRDMSQVRHITLHQCDHQFNHWQWHPICPDAGRAEGSAFSQHTTYAH